MNVKKCHNIGPWMFDANANHCLSGDDKKERKKSFFLGICGDENFEIVIDTERTLV
jgi:hypothetical protein